MKCPFCTEEIKDEAILCRYCRHGLAFLGADRSKNQTDNVSLDHVKTVMNKLFLPIPRLWIAVISAGIVISLFEVTPTAENPYTLSFRLTSVTVLLLALVWLPFLLKVIALTGEGLKALGSEASFQGLSDFLSQLSPEVEEKLLPSVIAAIRLTEETSTGTNRVFHSRILANYIRPIPCDFDCCRFTAHTRIQSPNLLYDYILYYSDSAVFCAIMSRR